MNAIQSLCDAGGTIRITVFRANFDSQAVKIISNVIVSCTIIDKSELIPINIFSVKGMLKYFHNSGKYFLDMTNSKDSNYPNFWFGSGFSDYVSAYTIKKMSDLLPGSSDYNGKESRIFVEFRVLEDGSIVNVDIKNAYKHKKKNIADNIANIIIDNDYIEEIEGEQLSIDKILDVSENDGILVNS
jgi:hypothetical protein